MGRPMRWEPHWVSPPGPGLVSLLAGVRHPGDARAPRRLHQRWRVGRQRVRRPPRGDRGPTLARRLARARHSTTADGKCHAQRMRRRARTRDSLGSDGRASANSNGRVFQTRSRHRRLHDVYRPRNGYRVRARAGAARHARRSRRGTQGLRRPARRDDRVFITRSWSRK